MKVQDWTKLPDGWTFHEVSGVGVDERDRVYVFNRGEHPLIVFDRDGNFVTAWGEYLLCVTLVDDEARRTMPVVLAAAQGGQGQWAWPNLAAVYVIVVTPGILAFTFAQKLFFKGLMEGVLKG